MLCLRHDVLPCAAVRSQTSVTLGNFKRHTHRTFSKMESMILDASWGRGKEGATVVIMMLCHISDGVTIILIEEVETGDDIGSDKPYFFIHVGQWHPIPIKRGGCYEFCRRFKIIFVTGSRKDYVHGELVATDLKSESCHDASEWHC